jgi:predicted transcriptional regulator
MENMELRNNIIKLRLKNYEVARELGITATTFSRWLQVPLTPAKKELIENAMQKLYQQNQEVSIERIN